MAALSIAIGITAIVLAIIPIGLTQLVGVSMGLLAVIVAKSICFCRNVADDGCQYGVPFSDEAVIPDSGRFETAELTNDLLIVKK